MSVKKWAPFEKWVRPTEKERTYCNAEFEEVINQIASEVSDGALRELFINCISNTLDTTTYFSSEDGEPRTYVITGDIEAMWLRDSTLQLKPYLPFIRESKRLCELFLGLANSQAHFITMDPYANAFYKELKFGIHATDFTDMKPGIHERKWELDSLCFHLFLLVEFSRESQSLEIFSGKVIQAIEIILRTFREQQRLYGHGPYFFDRNTDNLIDTLSNNGFGPASKYTGMVHSSFRPSDDACTYPFHIPSNLFASKLLADLAGYLDQLNQGELASSCLKLTEEIDQGIANWGIIDDPALGRMYCYESNGLGDYLLIDDANIPNLTALPFLGVVGSDDSLYIVDRKFALSAANPYFYSGKYGQGIGSPHTPQDHIWPISLITEAITTNDPLVWERVVRILVHSSAGTGLLHESFAVSDVKIYTRPWFAWCNSYFGEFIIHIWRTNPTFLNEFSSLIN